MTEILVGKTLLIVDDEPDLRTPLVTEFESVGCVVFEAPNGRRALQMIQENKIDAVISDIRMPGGDGVELLKNIKSLHHAVPTVMLITGFSDLSREDAYDLGAEAILAKPFDLDEIDEVVRRILTPSRARWNAPLTTQEAHKTIEKTFLNFEKALSDGQLNIGRGGLFLKTADPVPYPNEKVSLQIRFESGDFLQITGSGIVRWVRYEDREHDPRGLGVEFQTLDKESIEMVLKMSDVLKIKAFIPKH